MESKSTSTVVGSTVTAGKDVSITAQSGDVTVQASKVQAGEQIALKAEAGQVQLLAGQDSAYHAETHTSSNAVWQTAQDKGRVDETTKYADLQAGKGIEITAAKGVVAELHTGGAGLQSTVAALAAKPETAWMAQVASRNDVAWRNVQEAHDSWDYKSQGLSASGAAIVAIAVMVATQGMGVEALGMMGVEGITGASAAMVNAGFSSLVAQASVSMINNRGNIGKVLQELGSAQTVKTLAITVASAGAFYEVGTLTGGHFTEAGKTIGGKTAGQYFASSDYFGNVAGHALVGGAASVAGGGDFTSGALSGGFGAAVTPVSIMLNQQIPYTGLATTVAVGGTAATLGGGTFGQGAMNAGLGYLFNAGFKNPDGSLGWEGERNGQAAPSVSPLDFVGGGVAAGLVRGIGRLFTIEVGVEAITAENAGAALTSGQAANLTRFVDKLPRGAGPVAVDTLGEDYLIFTATVPGRVPGSYAVYQKVVDSIGKTTDYIKTTFDPLWNVVHTKIKY